MYAEVTRYLKSLDDLEGVSRQATADHFGLPVHLLAQYLSADHTRWMLVFDAERKRRLKLINKNNVNRVAHHLGFGTTRAFYYWYIRHFNISWSSYV